MHALTNWPVIATLTLLRILLAGLFLGVLVPWFMFPQRLDPESSPWVTRALWMTFWVSCIVHILAGLNLYEALLFLVLSVLVGGYNRLIQLSPVDRHRIIGRALGWILDRVDGKPFPWRPKLVPPPVPRGERALRWFSWTVLVVVLGISAWLLGNWAFHTPAPALSDAPVNLAWLKYIENRLPWSTRLFHNEVYPRGLYAVFSLLHKYVAGNALPLVVLMGPVDGLLIVLSLCFFIYKTTRSYGAVVVAATLYGTLARFLPMDFTRHGAPNSQEFGMIFVLPAAWYAYAYLTTGRTADRTTTAAAAGMVAFSHPIDTLFMLATLPAAGLVGLLQGGRAAWKRLLSLLMWVTGAGAIAVAPMVIALATGQRLHDSSVAYLQSAVVQLPELRLDHAGIALGMALLVPVLLIVGRRWQNLRPLAPAALVSAAGLLLYLLPALGVASEPLADRGRELGALALTVAAAVVWTLLERILGRYRSAGVLLSAALAAAALLVVKPTPMSPYHHYTDGMIRVYLGADAQFLAGEWTLVTGHTGYALALGRGGHLYPDQFVEMADHMPSSLAKWATTKWQGVTPNMHYVLIVERTIPSQTLPDETVQRQQFAATLDDWIQENRRKYPLQHVYTDADVDAWLLDIPQPVKEFGVYQPAPLRDGPLNRR